MDHVVLDLDLSVIGKLVSYLRTDKVPYKLDHVLKPTGSPVGFARRIMKDRSDLIYREYAHDVRQQFPNLPKPLQDGWVYEQVFRAAVEYRIVNLFLNDDDQLNKKRLEAIYAIMLVYDQHVKASCYTGFFYFKDNSYKFIDANIIPANASRIGITKRFISTIGSITDSNWILHNPVWYKTLSDNIDLFKTLRGFIQISSTNVYHTVEGFNRIHEVDLLELLDHMETFIDLREASDVTSEDIRTFLESVEHYALDIPVSAMYHILYGGPYGELQKFFMQTSHMNNDSDGSTIPEFDQYSLVKFISKIDNGETIQLVLEGTTPPKLIVQQLYDRFTKTDKEDFIGEIFKNEWFRPFHVVPKSARRRNELVRDHLLMVVMGLKYAKIVESDEASVINFLANTSHLMLDMIDETETMGLSIVSTLLPFYIRAGIHHLSEREIEIVSLLLNVWEQCHYDTVRKISPIWKNHFKNPVVTRGLRSIFFSLAEVLMHDDQVDYPFAFHVTREEFFNYLENLCEYLTTTPMTEEVEEFFSNRINPKKNIYTTPHDFLMWVGDDDELQVL